MVFILYFRSPTTALNLNLPLTGNFMHYYFLKIKTHSVWFISLFNSGETEHVFINHLLLVIPVSYPCHYTNLCPHKPHKHAHTFLLNFWYNIIMTKMRFLSIMIIKWNGCPSYSSHFAVSFWTHYSFDLWRAGVPCATRNIRVFFVKTSLILLV